MHIAIYVRRPGSEPDLPIVLRQVVEGRGDIVIATYFDDSRTTGRGRFAGWRSLIAHLDNVDQIVVASAGDLPGKRFSDLLKILAILRHHGVGLYVHNERIDTISNGFALLDLIQAYRQTKLSQAIRAGQARAAAAGKRIGRPKTPTAITHQIKTVLANGGGIRETARRFGVSPASVIAIRSQAASVHASG